MGRVHLLCRPPKIHGRARRSDRRPSCDKSALRAHVKRDRSSDRRVPSELGHAYRDCTPNWNFAKSSQARTCSFWALSNFARHCLRNSTAASFGRTLVEFCFGHVKLRPSRGATQSTAPRSGEMVSNPRDGQGSSPASPPAPGDRPGTAAKGAICPVRQVVGEWPLVAHCRRPPDTSHLPMGLRRSRQSRLSQRQGGPKRDPSRRRSPLLPPPIVARSQSNRADLRQALSE